MAFNFFGCTHDDIISSFSGAISGDFATSIYSTSTVLEKELEYAEAQILDKLNFNIIKNFKKVNGIKLEWNNLDGYEIPSEIPYLSGGNFRVWPFIENNILGLNLTQKLPCDLDITKVTDSTAYTISGNTLYLDNYTYNPDDNIYVSYDVDTSLIELNSLGSLVRDIVCCQLGSNLYSQNTDEWKLITRFCERAKEQLAMIDEYYIPYEYKQFEWFKPLVKQKSGFSTIHMRRA